MSPCECRLMVDGPAVVMAKAIWKKANRPSPKPVECIFLLLFLVLYIFIFPQTDELTLNSKKNKIQWIFLTSWKMILYQDANIRRLNNTTDFK